MRSKPRRYGSGPLTPKELEIETAPSRPSDTAPGLSFTQLKWYEKISAVVIACVGAFLLSVFFRWLLSANYRCPPEEVARCILLTQTPVRNVEELVNHLERCADLKQRGCF